MKGKMIFHNLAGKPVVVTVHMISSYQPNHVDDEFFKNSVDIFILSSPEPIVVKGTMSDITKMLNSAYALTEANFYDYLNQESEDLFKLKEEAEEAEFEEEQADN